VTFIFTIMPTSKSYLRLLLPVLVLVLLTSACVPRTMIHLTPATGNPTFFDDGREFVTLQQDSVQFLAAFDRCDDKYLIFNVEVTNLSSQPVTIDPARFYYRMQDSLRQVQYGNGWQVPQSFALSPNQEVVRLEKELQREEARLKARRTLWTVVAVAATVATAAAVIENNSRSSRGRESGWRRAANNNNLLNAWSLSMSIAADGVHSSTARYYWQKDNLAGQKETWESYALWTKTLQPGEKIYGDAVFNPHVGTGELQFVFPVDNRTFVINFNQERRLIKH